LRRSPPPPRTRPGRPPPHAALPAAGRQAAALVPAGYARREADDADRRAHRITSTDAGQRVLKESHRRMVHAVGRALEDWTAQEVEGLSAGLARLREDFIAASNQETVTS